MRSLFLQHLTEKKKAEKAEIENLRQRARMARVKASIKKMSHVKFNPNYLRQRQIMIEDYFRKRAEIDYLSARARFVLDLLTMEKKRRLKKFISGPLGEPYKDLASRSKPYKSAREIK